MSQLPILEVPNPILKKTCAPVDEVDRELRKLMDDMIETMYEAPGIGLAAPQVGVLKRLFVMDVSEGKDDPIRLINPEIDWLSPETRVAEEGCLSLPNQFADIKRPKAVRIHYMDENGARQEMEAEGLLGRCIQHEIDHLNGILFTDHVSALKRNMIMRKLAKYRKQAS